MYYHAGMSVIIVDNGYVFFGGCHGDVNFQERHGVHVEFLYIYSYKTCEFLSYVAIDRSPL